MQFFKEYFNEITEWETEEVKVICPFHNDSNPSASVNTEKGLFHCWVCDVGYNELQFIQRVKNITQHEALKLMQLAKNNNSSELAVTKGRLWANMVALQNVKTKMKIEDDLIEELNLGLQVQGGVEFLTIPVLVDGGLIDLRRYNINKDSRYPKLMANENSLAGAVIPYDTWRVDKDNATYIVEGEKDMLIARQEGLNAICLTGGANSEVHSTFLEDFKGREVYILYDNDEAGRNGSNKIGLQLQDICDVNIIDISQFVQGKGEDLFDFLDKYNGDVFDILMAETSKPKETEKVKKFSKISHNLRDNVINKTVLSEVTVTSEYSDQFAIPTKVVVKKGEETNSNGEKMIEGEERMWTLDDDRPKQILELIEVDAKEKNVNQKLKSFMGLDEKEKNITIKKSYNVTIYKTAIIDKETEGNPSPIDLYSFVKMQVGQQYIVKYKLLAHPNKHQKLVALAYAVQEVGIVNELSIDKSKLNKFIISGSIDERVKYLYEATKHHIAKHTKFDIWLMCDLVFNSILDFNYGEKIRGALDVFILGDSQTGKSETSTRLINLYNFGQIQSLKTSTTIGLIGGSTKVDGSWCNTIGAIPRQHQKLVVLEEFSGADQSFIKTMTDIRSSNKLRIARASGELTVDCKTRMITISNPVNDTNGIPKNLATFPNGILPITELITSSEDIARYDGFLLVPKVEKMVNPFKQTITGDLIEKEAYVYKNKWIVSRLPENVIISDDVASYIWEKADEMNKKYESNFLLFTTTTSKKLARFCVALAALIVNVDETYQNIVVTEEIVNYVVDFLNSIYSSRQFGLDSYKKEYVAYNECDDNDVKEVEEMYIAHSVLLTELAKESRMTRNALRVVSGIEKNELFSPLFNKLVRLKFLKLEGESVIPTQKYRQAFSKANKVAINVPSTTTDNQKPIDLNLRRSV